MRRDTEADKVSADTRPRGRVSGCRSRKKRVRAGLGIERANSTGEMSNQIRNRSCPGIIPRIRRAHQDKTAPPAPSPATGWPESSRHSKTGAIAAVKVYLNSGVMHFTSSVPPAAAPTTRFHGALFSFRCPATEKIHRRFLGGEVFAR